MASLGADRLAGIELICGVYPKLKEREPTHPLLQYIQEITAEEIKLTTNPEIEEEFFERYTHGKPGAPWAYILANYFVDLHIALEGKTPSGVETDPNSVRVYQVRAKK